MVDLKSNSIVYINLDNVMLNFYKSFRVKHYFQILIMKKHPLDFNIYTYYNKPNIKKIVDELVLDNGIDFWINLPKTSVCKFYWHRLSEYTNRIYFLTNYRTESEQKGKIIWVNTNLKMYDNNKIIFTNNIPKYAKSKLFNNILIDSNSKMIDSWNNAGGIGLLDLNKRAVASYYIDKSIVPHLELYKGVSLLADIPQSARRLHRISKYNEDIRSVSLDDCNMI